MGKRKKIIILLVIVFLGLFITAYIPIKTTKSLDKLISEGVAVNNENVGLLSTDDAKKLIEEKYNMPLENKQFQLTYEKDTFTKSFKDFNVRYDTDKAVQEAFVYGKNGNNIIKRTLDRITNKVDNHNVEMELLYDTKPIDDLVGTLSKKINKDPVDAKLAFKNGKFITTKEILGKRVDEAKLRGMIKNAIISGTENIDIPVAAVEPKLKADFLSKVNQNVASFTTHLSSNSDRTTNIRIAAGHINGTLLLPGDTFSANGVIGHRRVSGGYKEAPVYNNGKVETGIAGGICQVSTTIYNTALYANLKIVERYPHSLPVSYVPKGRDATITDGGADLKFRNTLNYPIYIQTIVTDKLVTVNFYGYKENPGQKIELVSETVDRGDKSVYKTYRKIYQNNKLVKTELLSSDSYKPHP